MSTDQTTSIAANIKAARAQAGLTQRALAELVGVDTMAVSRWERGLHRPSPRLERRLAGILCSGDVATLYSPSDEEAR